ncbi:MAG: hypothetical protein IPP87_02870 [Ideonella sp.]|nr:hypothetical protein [Ideonella sp.]
MATIMAAQVAAVQVHMVYGRLRTNVLLTLGACLPFFALLYPFFDARQMQVWLAVILLVSAGRYLLWHRFMASRPEGDSLKAWDHWFTAWSIAAGASWAYGPLVLMPAAGRIESILLLGCLLSVCSVAAVTQSVRRTSMMLFLSAALMPTVWALHRTGGRVEGMAALEVVAGFCAMALVGTRLHQMIGASIQTELELSQTVTQLEQARERAEAASVAKTRFLANMSHELRSPLNAVIGAAQLMKSGQQDAAGQAVLVDAIHHSGSNLLGLIENIMDLSRIEAGRLSLADAPFDLAESVQAAMVTAAVAGRAKGLTVSCQIEPDMPLWRRGDALRVRQLLLNLLGNAVKFTPQGEVSVRVRAGGDADAVSIAVSDTGVGISAEALPTVFDAFRQADDGADRRFGGSGLGLAIVRQLVDAMGGHISVRSVVGQGTEFELMLPLPRTCPEVAVAPSHAMPAVDRSALARPSAPAVAAGRTKCWWWRMIRSIRPSCAACFVTQATWP